MPKYPGISPYDNEKGTLGTAKKRWEKLYVKEIESDTIDGVNATVEYLATTAENSVANAVAAKNAAVDAKAAAETAAETAATAAAGIQSVVESDVDNTLTIPGVAADAKVTGDWLRDIAKPVTLDTSMPATAYAEEYMKVTTDSEGRVLYGVKRDGTFTWQKGVPKHLQDKINELAAPTIDNDEYMYVMLDSEGHVLFGVKRDGSFDWQKGLPKPVKEKLEEVAQTVIDSEEFLQYTVDTEGKLIEGIARNGDKRFFSPVSFVGGVRWTEKAAEGITEYLKDISGMFFDYKKYIKAPFRGNWKSGLDVLYLNGDTSGMTKDNKKDMTFEFQGIQGDCTCKWQGASSISFPKKNFTIAKMNPAIDVGWGTFNKYCLKGDFSDYSHARNVGSAKLWGKMVKSRTPENARLSVLPNGGAIDGFPIMLVINGEYQGVYNLTIPKDPWLLGMGSGEHEAMVNAEVDSATTRFKATVSREDLLDNKYWEIEYIPDKNNPDWLVNSFNTMLQACIDSTGANYRETLEDYLDIESAIDYYIHLCLLGSVDNVAHNFIMGTFDGTKWFFNAYDLDWTFGAYGFCTSWISAKSDLTFKTAEGRSRVFHLIYTYDKAALKARYNELREGCMSEESIMNVISNYIAPIPKPALDEDARIWPTTPGTLMSDYAQIVEWYRNRVVAMDNEISNM